MFEIGVAVSLGEGGAIAVKIAGLCVWLHLETGRRAQQIGGRMRRMMWRDAHWSPASKFSIEARVIRRRPHNLIDFSDPSAINL